jgi:hypothetical protein
MGPIRVIAAPIRRLATSRLFQLAIVLAIILALDHYSYDYSALRRVAEGLKGLVTASVALFSDLFRVGILTDPVLQVGLMIAYVYVFCLLIFLLLRLALGVLIDRMGRSNFLWLRNSIARERGIAAYRAWLPLERIRPPGYPQDKWEAEFAWPPDNKPPYPPLPQRALRAAIGYLAVLAAIAILLQLLTPCPVLTWIRRLI